MLQLRQRWDKTKRCGRPCKTTTRPSAKRGKTPSGSTRGRGRFSTKTKSFLPTELAGIKIPAKKPESGNFYPSGVSKQAIETWMQSLSPTDKEQAQWFYRHSQRHRDGRFKIVKYSDEYKPELEKLAALLRQSRRVDGQRLAAEVLTLRADACLSNDYLPSDFAWMDLDSPVDITIGPYETYNDEWFGYKAAFEAYKYPRPKETNKLNFFGQHMQELEDHLTDRCQIPQSQGGRAGSHGGGK